MSSHWLLRDALFVLSVMLVSAIPGAVSYACVGEFYTLRTGVLPTGDLAFGPLSFGVTLVMLLVGQHFRIRRFKQQLEAAVVSEPTEEVFREACRNRRFLAPTSFLTELATTLAKNGGTNCVLELSFSDAHLNAQPIQHPFEPRRLDETDATFLDLYSAACLPGSSSNDQSGTGRPIHSRDGMFSQVRRILAKKWMRWGAPVFFLGGCLTVQECIRKGSFDFPSIMFFAIGLIAFLLLILHDPLNGWYVIPGGLYLRQSPNTVTIHIKSGSGANPQVPEGKKKNLTCLASPKRHLLMLLQLNRDFYLAQVTDGVESHELNLTRREAELLLCAWTSPIMPPDPAWIEKLLQGVGPYRQS